MQKKYFFIVFFLAIFWNSVNAQNISLPRAEISFVFNRQGGFSTNQFAVWIEDNQGNHVRTLYATKFTAAGGWKRRPNSIPLWVQKSGLSSLDKKETDALSGATPRTGTLNYGWDGLDKNGNPGKTGEYRLFLEATLRGDSKVLYSASFSLGSGAGNPVQVEVKTEYFGDNIKERAMIENVKILYRP